MTIFTDTFHPYEFEGKRDAYNYIEERCQGLKKALRYIEMDNEHLVVRCPIVGDYLEITGTAEEINWLHAELTKRELYRIK